MAGRKENPVLTACQAPSGRITRAQAAANRGRFGFAPSVSLPARTERKQTAKGKTKRGALDEITSVSTATSAPQPKRRTVLKDVTNIGCANSSKNCTTTSKLQQKSKPTQRVKQIPSKKQCAKKVPKLPPPAVAGTSFVIDSKSSEETQKVELLAKAEEPTNLFENEGLLSLQNIERNRDSNCHEAFFEARNTMDKHELADSKPGDSSGLGFIDIDNDNGNPQMCASYASEIYTNLMASEVSEEYKLVPDTLYLTINLIDRFLSQHYIERQKLQLLGITSMLIASKYEEICAPRVEEFCFITDNTYTKAEVLKMEGLVLNDLGFHLSVPTTKTFLRRFLRAAQASRNNHTLEHYTSYKSSDIQICVCALRELQHNTSNCPLNAIREKYRQQKAAAFGLIIILDQRVQSLERELDAAISAAARARTEKRQAEAAQRAAELRAQEVTKELENTAKVFKLHMEELRAKQEEIAKKESDIKVLEAIIRTLSNKDDGGSSE
uniref:Cyclin-like domain-containing protein n=2 Tax=Oryza TaxID=4527 RepID=A0A0E0BT23_9ORYZ